MAENAVPTITVAPQTHRLVPMQVRDPCGRRVSTRPPATSVMHVHDVYRMHRGRLVPSIKGLFQHFCDEGRVSIELAVRLLTDCSVLLEREPTVVSVGAPCVVVGDLHGQFYDLAHIIRDIQPPGQAHNYLFLGDYCDRGAFSWEVILLLCALKVRYPMNVFLLCGNHEDRTMNHAFTFIAELRHKIADTPRHEWGGEEFIGNALSDERAQQAYKVSGLANLPGSNASAEILSRFVYGRVLTLFQALPLAAILDNRFFCVHGGIGPEFASISDVRAIDRFRDHMPGHTAESTLEDREAVARGTRLRKPAYEPNAGFGAQAAAPTTDAVQTLLWSDPAPAGAPPGLRFVANRRRGAGYVFGFAGASAFLRESHLLSIIRAHEVKEPGFEFGPAHPETRFPVHFTIFSAANYAGHYPNRGAVLVITPDNISVRQFASQPQPFVLPSFQDAITYTLPIITEASCDMFSALLRVVNAEEDAAFAELECAGDVDAWATKARPPTTAPPAAPTPGPAPAGSPTPGPGTPGPAPGGAPASRRTPAEMAELRARLRSKLRAITIFRNMQNTLRAEREACLRLKALNGGVLPYGLLRQGSAGVHAALQSYEEAVAADLASEANPDALPGSIREAAADTWIRDQRAAALSELANLSVLAARAETESASGSESTALLSAGDALDPEAISVAPLAVRLVQGADGQFSFSS